MNADEPMPGCPCEDAVIARFLDGDACPPGEVPNELLDLHLQDCPACRRALERARRLDALVAGSAGNAGACEADGDQVSAWLSAAAAAGAAAAPPVVVPRTPIATPVRVALGALLLLAALVVVANGYALISGGPRPDAPRAQEPEQPPQSQPGERTQDGPVLTARESAPTDASVPWAAGTWAAGTGAAGKSAPGTAMVVLPDVAAEPSGRPRAGSPSGLETRRLEAPRLDTLRLDTQRALETPETRTAALQLRIDHPVASSARQLVGILLRRELELDACTCLLAEAAYGGEGALLDLHAAVLAATWQSLACQALRRLPGTIANEQLLAPWMDPLTPAQETALLAALAARGDDALAAVRTRLRTGSPESALAAARVALRLDAQAFRADLLGLWSRSRFAPGLGLLIERELQERPGDATFALALQAALAACAGVTPREEDVRWFHALPPRLAAQAAQRGEQTALVQERILCLRVLGMSGDDSWLAALRLAAESRHMDERVAGHLGLRDLGTRSATAALIELSERSRHPWTAVASLITSPSDAVRNEGLARAPAGTPVWAGEHAGPDTVASLELQLGRLARRGP